MLSHILESAIRASGRPTIHPCTREVAADFIEQAVARGDHIDHIVSLTKQFLVEQVTSRDYTRHPPKHPKPTVSTSRHVQQTLVFVSHITLDQHARPIPPHRALVPYVQSPHHHITTPRASHDVTTSP